MHAYNRLTVDLGAIKKNLEVVAHTLPPRGRIMPMVKASGYGTDALICCSYFKKWGIGIVGVSHVNEGATLRQKGCDLAIFAIHAAPFEIPTLVQNDLEVAVSNSSFCQLLNAEALRAGKKIKVHLDINTGMQRFGCRPDEALNLSTEILSLPGLILEGVMTHFVAAENPEFDSFSQDQIELFKSVIAELQNAHINPPWIHVANSAAALRQLTLFCNMVRIGIATFGIYSSEVEKQFIPLTSALSLESKIVCINECHKGESIGYLRSYIVTRSKMKIAILPIGYHDGLHLQYSGKGYVLIRGQKAPFVGRICMDFMMCDITDIEGASVGDRALLFGKDNEGNQIPLELFASWGSNNAREVLVSLGPRVERHFILYPTQTIPLSELLEKQSIPQEMPC